jgi:hypothetical protein
VGYSLHAAAAGADGGLDLTDTSQFTALDAPWGTVPARFDVVASVPALPRFGAAYLSDAILIGAALVPGRGLVPLGAGFGVNTTPMDSALDKEPGLIAAGLATLRLAPEHHGIEGSPYVVTAYARSSRPDVPPPSLATAAVVMRVPNDTLSFDPTGATPLMLPAFAAVPETGTWTSGTRSFAFTAAPAIASETAVRVTFTTAGATRWSVVSDAQSPAFKLPAAPNGFADRTLRGTGGTSSMKVEVMRLKPDLSGNTVSFNGLVEHNSVDLDDLLESTVAVSIVDTP